MLTSPNLLANSRCCPSALKTTLHTFLGCRLRRAQAQKGVQGLLSGWALSKERGGGRKGARMDQTHAQVSQAHSFTSLSSPPVAIHVPQREKSIARMHSECGPAAVESVRLAAPTLTKGDFSLAYN